jgi:PAS domain S-box-containing protein
MAKNDLKILIGWKEIAAYLDCSRSTAARRVEDGLPVFNVGGNIRAFTADIDRWIEGERLRKLEDRREADVESGAVVVNDTDVLDTVTAYVREGKGRRFAVVPLGIDSSEYERIEDRLKTAEEKSRWVLETIPVWVWETDAAGEYTYSNVASLDIIGYRPEELAGFKPSDFLVYKEDVPLYDGEIGNLRKKRAAVRDLRCRFLTREDDIRWFEVDAEPAFDARGKFAGVRGVSRDVTARVRAEEKEKEHLAILSFLSRTATDFVAFDPEGDLFAYVADKLRELVGDASVALTSYDEAADTHTVRATANLGAKTRAILKALGKDPVGMVVPSTGVLRSALLEGKLGKYAIPLHELTGGIISKNLSRELQDLLGFGGIYLMGIVRHGKLLGVASVIPSRGTELRNLEVVEAFINQAAVAIQRKSAEEAYRESEDKYRRLVDKSLVGLYITQEHIIKFCNQRLVEMFGYDKAEELCGKHVRALVDPESWDAVDEKVKLRESEREESAHYIFKALKKDGTPFDVETLGTRIIYEGRPAIQGGMIDITERKRAEAARERERTAFRIIAEAAVETADAPALCERVVGGLVEALGFDFGTAEQFDAEKGGLTSACAVGLSRKQLTEKEVAVSLEDERHLSAYTARRREGLFVPDVREHAINETHGEWLEELGVRGFISWPLIGADDQLLGVLQLGGRKPKVIAEGDQVFFATVAGMFATVLERRRAEEALEESETRHRELFEGSPAAITVVSSAGVIVDVNKATEELTGYSREELCDKQFTELVTLAPEDLPGLTRRFEALLRGEAGEPYDLEIIRKDGATRWIRVRNSLLREGDTLAGIQVISLDITDRKRAQEALEESEEKFRNVVERANDGIALIKNGRFVYINPRIAEASGYAAEELLSQPFTVFLDPEEIPKVSTYYEKRVREEDVPAVYETVLRGKDGSKIYVELNVGTVPYQGETAVLAFVRDLTERKRAEELAQLQRDLALALAEPLELDAALRLCVGAALRAGGMDAGGIYLVDDVTGALDLAYSEGLGAAFVASASHFDGDSPNARLIGAGEPVYSTHTGLGIPLSKERRKESLRAIAVLPVKHEGRVVACLNVASHARDEFDVNARAAVEAVAAQIGGVIARLRAQKALEESEDKFRSLVERANDGIAIVVEGRIAYANPRVSEATGYAAQDLLGEPFAQFVDPEDLPKVSAYYEKRMKGEEVPAVYEIAVRRKDGGKLYVELNVGTVSYQGQIAELVFIRDLTERMKAEETRERERKTFRIIAEAAVQAKSLRELCRHVVAGLAEALAFEIGTVRLYNEETKTLDRTASYGLTRDEIDEYFPAQSVDDRRYFAAHVARTRKPIFAPDVTQRKMAKTHRPRVKELGVAAIISWPILGAEGVLLGVMNLASRTPKDIAEEDRVFFETVAGMFATVLERRQAEDDVRKSEAKHRLLLESIGSPVLALDQKMNILYYNDAYAASVDLAQGEAEGENLLELFPSFAETESYQAYAEALATDTPQEAEGEFGERYLRTAVYPMPWGILAIATDITERKQAEGALRESEELYRTSIETSPDAIAVTDLEGKIIMFNRQAVVLHGLEKPEDLMGKNAFDFVAPEDRPRAIENMRKTLAEGPTRDGEFELVKRNGTRFPGEISVSVLKDADGNARGFIGVIRDIAERKRAEEAVLSERDKAQRYLDIAGVMMLILGADQKIKLINDKGCEILGCGEDEVLGKNWFDNFIPENIREEVKDIYDKSMAGEIEPVEYFENPILTKTGVERIIAWHNVFLKDSAGNVTGTLSSGEDITERKRVEAALRESEERYRVLFEGGNDAVFVFNLTDGGKPSPFVEVNEEACRRLGYSAEELHQLTPADLVPPESRAAAAEKIRQLTEDKELIFEWVHLRKDGTEIPVEISAHFFEFRGEPTVISVARDITERKRAQEALRESQRRYELTTEAARVGIWDWDLATDDIYVDPKLKAMLGYDDDEIPNRLADWGQHVHPDDGDRCFAEAQAHLRGEKPLYECEHRMLTKDGEVVWFLARGTALRDENGKPYRVVGTDTDITERKLAEEELRRETEFSENILNTAVDTVFVFDPQTGKPLRWNKAFSEVSGYSDEEIAAKKAPDDWYSPEDLKRAAATIEGIFAEGSGIVEMSLIAKDGRTIPTEYVGSLVKDAEGNPQYIISVGRDVTERKRAEEALRESEEKFRNLAEESPNMIFISLGVKMAYANKKTQEVMGYTREELYAEDFNTLEMVAPESRELVTRGMAAHARGEEIAPFEYVVQTKSGEKLQAIIAPKLITFGGETASLGIVTDISEQKRAQEALRESEEKYRATVEQARDGIVIIVDGKLAFVNDYYAAMLGRAKEDLIGRSILDVLPPRLREGFAARYERALESGVTPEPVDAILLAADGREIPVETVSADVTYGGRPAILVIIRDVTERREAKKKIRRAEREKTAILRSMSEHVVYHDTELTILWTNEAAASSVGLSPESLVGRHCYEVWHDRKKPCPGCPVAAALETGGTHEAEVTTRDGRVWFVRGYAVTDEAGNVTNAVEVTLEVTERKRAEESLKRALAENEALLEAVPDLMFIVDKDGNYVDFKRTEADLFALPPDTIIGKNIRDTGFRAEEEREILARLEEVLRTGVTATVEYTLQTPRGPGVFEARMTKLNDDEVLSVVREITEQKEAEEALQREKRFSGSLMSSLPGIFYVFDAEGRFRWWNENLETVTGYSADEVSRMRPPDFFRGRDKEVIVERIARALSEGYATAEVSLYTKGGAAIPHFFTGKRVEIHGKTYLMGMGMDLTELARAEEDPEE